MIYVIINGKKLKAKKREQIETVKRVFLTAGLEHEFHYTESKGHAKELTQKFTSTGEKCTVVNMGGDGTLHEVINGFKDFENCNLGLIPFGTGNDFAAAAKIPSDVKKAAEIIAFNCPRPIDFIELECGLRSINAIGMGIDVDVLKRTYSGTNKGRSKYLKALIVSLMKFKSYNFTARFNGKSQKHFGLIAALGNGRQFGGGIPAFPNAKIDDGYMDLIITDFISKPKIIDAFAKLMAGKINKVKAATHELVTEAEFINESEKYTVQADGELYEDIPFKAHIVSGKLKFHLPC